MERPDSAARTRSLDSDYATVDEAMRQLDVRRQTLYAYVSRGWLRSIGQPGRKERLYLRDDLERLGARSQARTGRGAAAASAMNLGEPIVTTGITRITPDGPAYRGHAAVDLAAAGFSFEAVCELLWTGVPAAPDLAWQRNVTASPGGAALLPIDGDAPAGCIDGLAMLAIRLGAAREQVDELAAARALIQAFVAALGSSGAEHAAAEQGGGPSRLAPAIASALGLPDTATHRAVIDHVLTLVADHELAPGTLVARVAASGGATLHHCIASALCASSGSQVAQLYSRVDDFLAGAVSAEVLVERAHDLQRRGVLVPGFTHSLYPRGDPRATSLLALARNRLAMTRELEATLGFVEAMAAETAMHPRHELALVAICRAMGLRRGAAGALFAIARTAGWVAHVQEQRASCVLLRPRARFETPGR